jgi:anti-sigma factor RsiW
VTEHHHDVEVHLATCPRCAAEAAQYREVRHAVATLRDELEQAPPGLVASVVGRVDAAEGRWIQRAWRVAHDRRVHVAAASLGGAVLGAGAIALIVWRTARRGVPRAA